MQCLCSAYVLFMQYSSNLVGLISKHANNGPELINMLCIELDSRMLVVKLFDKHAGLVARAHLLAWYAQADKNLTPTTPHASCRRDRKHL